MSETQTRSRPWSPPAAALRPHRFLVNNAGVVAAATIAPEKIPDALFDQTIRVNVLGTGTAAAKWRSVMLTDGKGGSKIVNMASESWACSGVSRRSGRVPGLQGRRHQPHAQPRRPLVRPRRACERDCAGLVPERDDERLVCRTSIGSSSASSTSPAAWAASATPVEHRRTAPLPPPSDASSYVTGPDAHGQRRARRDRRRRHDASEHQRSLRGQRAARTRSTHRRVDIDQE